jgi:hypothetical protein
MIRQSHKPSQRSNPHIGRNIATGRGANRTLKSIKRSQSHKRKLTPTQKYILTI